MELQDIIKLKRDIRDALDEIARMSNFYKRQQFYMASQRSKNLWDILTVVVEGLNAHIQEINGDIQIVSMESILEVLQNLQEAQQCEDYVLLTDLYELQLMPVLVSVQEIICSSLGVQIEEEILRKNISACQRFHPQLLYSLLPDELVAEIGEGIAFQEKIYGEFANMVERCFADGYIVEPTSCGYYTMAVQRGEHKYYLHSNGQITTEALLQAEEWLSQEKERYIFYGLGMGYPYREMLCTDHNISISVYETNREMLLLAMIFAPLAELMESGRFQLIYDPTGHRLEHTKLEISEKTGFYVFYPALRGVKKEKLQKQLESYFVDESSVRIHSRNLSGNFNKNIEADFSSIEQLRENLQGKNVIIVAAGPSLDKNIQELKNRSKDTILLVAGTVLQKLLNQGIRPDYVIIIDSGKPTYVQIEKVKDCKVPLIFLSTVFSWIPRDYQGKKYLLCQKGFLPAEELAEKNGWQTVETGGSVMTTALDLCLRLQVKSIVFVGLDLAFTDGLDHTSGTAYQSKIVQETKILVDAVNGGKVQTGKNLKIYLDWIENRLERRTAQEKQIPVIDATEGGARKRGMEIRRLKEILVS